MQERYEYEVKFSSYPDVVTIKELMLMLDGVCEHTALSLIQQDKIKHFRIGNQYRIPKACVIDYVLSEDYAKYSKSLKARV